jgi:hypothetical protein
MKAIENDEEAQAALAELPPDEKANVMLCGHSLGSVINFDIVLGVTGLRGSVAEEGDPASSVRREHEKANALLMIDTNPKLRQTVNLNLAPKEISRLEARAAFYTVAEELYQRIEPVGMITMGSPIAFFLFRKPKLFAGSPAAHRDLWKALWPQKEAGQDRRNGVKWRWQNFWHPADFVAHRLTPLYSQGFLDADGKPRSFVTDVKVSQAVQGPIHAHSSYWGNPTVHRLIGEQLAQALIDLNPPPQSTTGSSTAEGRSAP